MTVLAITITDAGRAAVVNAANTGTGPIVISQIALGSGKYTPTASQTAMVAEIKRLTTFGADVVAADTIHVTITDDTADIYNLSEIGLFTDTGVLFAAYSQPTNISSKTAQQIVLLSADIVFKSLPPGSVTIGDTDFMLPPATPTRQGVIEIADNTEIDAGSDNTRAITPAGLKRRIDTRSANGHTHTISNVTGLQTTLNNCFAHQADPGPGVDLNDVTDSGWYHQNSNTLAASGDNYPDDVAGLLCVHADDVMVYQTYLDYLGARSWFRARYNENWSAWRQCVDTTRSIVAGNGLTGGGDLGANRTLTLGTPGSCSGSTSNAVTATSHTHLIEAATTTSRGVIEIADNTEIDAGSDNTRAITPAGLKRRIDTRSANGHTHDDRYYTKSETSSLLSGKASVATAIAAGNGLTGGGSLGADRTLALGTPGSCSGSTSNAVTTTSHTHALSAATETAGGVARVATQSETEAGTDDTRIVTPKKLRSGFSVSWGTNGHIAAPWWLGRWIINWGKTSIAAGNRPITYSLAFPTAAYFYGAIKSDAASSWGPTNGIAFNKPTLSGAEIGSGESGEDVFWFAFGR